MKTHRTGDQQSPLHLPPPRAVAAIALPLRSTLAFGPSTNRRRNMDPASGRPPTVESSLVIAQIGNHEERSQLLWKYALAFHG